MPNPSPQPLRASFLTSAPQLRHCPDHALPELAFAGRSNAGKSSVLNRLTGTRDLARTSKTPGRTQAINFFALDDGSGCLVDLPGYGYAKTAKSLKERWQREIEAYLAERPQLIGVVLIMDIRHPLQAFDRQLLDWGTSAEVPMLVLLNKADKLKYGARQQTLATVQKALPAPDLQHAITFSALRGEGADTALATLRGWLASVELVPEEEGPDADAP